jgi:hypothetical protein
MKNLISLILILCLNHGFGQKGQERIFDCYNRIINDSTYYPKKDSNLGYFPDQQVQVKVALPDKDGSARIWVKGSASYCNVEVRKLDGSSLSKSIKLSPPYFVSLIKVNSNNDIIDVIFDDSSKKAITKRTVLHHGFKKRSNETFSFLMYGCFQPFRVDENNEPQLINDSKKPINSWMRSLFMSVGLETPVKFEENKPGSMEVERKLFKTETLLKKPLLVLGTGDQVYTDAGYEKGDFENHPLSAWSHTCVDPYPLLSSAKYQEHIQKMYHHFFSFESFDTLFRILPSINAIDDHEIRDGWGSHGDEYYNKNEVDYKLRPFYEISRSGFIEHQWQMSNDAAIIKSKKKNSMASLHQTFNVNGIQGFVFDLRTNRDINLMQVIDDNQMQDFKDWCANLTDTSEVIIMSSIPVFYGVSEGLEKKGKKIKKGELRDDVNDSWSFNSDQRNEIILELIKLREKNVKPVIISGDIHLGAMMEIWYEVDELKNKEILCYEMVTSALSHESLGEGLGRIAEIVQRKSYTGRKSYHEIKIKKVNNQIEVAAPVLRFLDSKLNFGGIEFNSGVKKNKTILSLFIVNQNQTGIVQRRMTLGWWQKLADGEINGTQQPLSSTYRPTIVDYRLLYDIY